MRLRQAVHRPVLRRLRQALREGGAERDGPHEQHRTERVRRVLHGRRHAPPCALDRLFDKASVFVMRGPSYRGRELDAYSVEAVPQAVKVRGIQPEGM